MYLRKLSISGISVVCGPASEDLCALKFTSESGRQDFIDGNPALAGALMTQTEASFIIWVRFTGFCPKSVKLDDNLTLLSHGQSVEVYERDQFKDQMRGALIRARLIASVKVQWPYELLRQFLFGMGNFSLWGSPIIGFSER